MKTIFQRDAGFFFHSAPDFFIYLSHKQHEAAQSHVFLHLLLSAPCQKRQMTWIPPFKNAAAHFGSFSGSNSTVQYLGLGSDSMEVELLSRCRVKLERVLWNSVMCTFNEPY